MNKGRKIIRNVEGFGKTTWFKCKRCGIAVPAENWHGDAHKSCDYFLSTRPRRDKDLKEMGHIFPI